ncbi:MAG: MarR family transcriptional regulator [Peptococcaceae bacterium]|nr:MarR family transcriptional regulator [Peptococcaceae bacterium]
MDAFSQELNDLLTDAFWSILRIEEQAANNVAGGDLSISEMHMLEAVSKDENGRTISELAADQNITLSSVTIAVNKLVKKGYVEKVRHEQDGRQVFVKLTKMGRKVNAGHLYFHENMVRNVSEGMSEEEKEVLLKGMKNLNRFFQRKLEPKEEA